MPRVLQISSYTARTAACSRGFNEWRHNIIIRTTEATTICDLRFVDDVTPLQGLEKVRESGPSQIYLQTAFFASTLHLLQSEKPLSVVLYESANRVLIQTDQEPPGDLEP